MAIARAVSSQVLLAEPNVESTSGKVNVDGVELYFERYGNGSHPILCIPGALAGADFFLPQINYFGHSGSGYTIVAYDPRGYGKSRPNSRLYESPRYYEIDAKDAVGLMRALGFKEFSLFGWSDGGTCAIITAARFPDVIKNLVIWGPHTYLEERDIQAFEHLRSIENWNPTIRAMMEKYYGNESELLFNKWLDGFISVYSDPEKEGDICKKDVGEVQCPTLLVHGDKDAIVPFSQIEFLQNNLHHCQFEIIHGGKHTLHWKYSSKFNKVADDFLNQ